MYSTCLFCNENLSTNEVIEHFPIGRRLAFDAAKGRLWVVCRKCERWNLTPLEERWEAIEECEREFRGTKLRVSTDEIGLARAGEGLELVRIGAPQRPEMAAWRYGDQFGRRMRRNIAWSGAGAAGLAALVWGGPALGLYAGSAVSGINLLVQGGFHLNYRRRVIARVRVGEAEDVEYLSLAREHVMRASVVQRGRGWELELPVIGGHEWTLTGDEAHRAVAQILPHVNATSGRARTVRHAVGLLEDCGSTERVFHVAARYMFKGTLNMQRGFVLLDGRKIAGTLAALPASIRIALEMATHEESERRALEGELAELHEAWRDAEEIAKIADDMFLPSGIEAALSRLKGMR
jgi:hypothetical protein